MRSRDAQRSAPPMGSGGALRCASRLNGTWVSRMRLRPALLTLPALFAVSLAWAQQPADVSGPINVGPRPVASDQTVKLDYDIVYVRAPRKGDAVGTNWPEISNPVFMD